MMRATLDEKILAKHWNGHLPVDIDQIMQDMGVQVRHTDTDAYCCKVITEGQQRIVLINPDESIVRQRFAKSLGLAIVMFGFTSTPPEVLKVGRGAFKDEYEGYTGRLLNSFAKKLIMPKYAIQHSIREEKVRDISKLATKFSVSEHLMAARLKDLKFLHN